MGKMGMLTPPNPQGATTPSKAPPPAAKKEI
eukprot:CAMPEP_0184302870 /NCGR_PEP_ID=MMETSP1049-20130417/12739_1 /TAXON_ID=77928 /ORGANISM="Proteomonas sulcata, Strain CCMP704" /LENGTH=30 /DNA_ID= /DNA_START= /DNA_END= /DNA_ORIENTATION=